MNEFNINNQNLNEKDFTIEAHQRRDYLLLVIQNGEQEKIEDILKIFDYVLFNDKLQLKKRIEKNELRSYKNLMITHNSLYGYVAEKGGLHPLDSHYMTEKYSIIIEHAASIKELNTIHKAMLYEYSDLNKRYFSEKLIPLTEKVANYINTTFSEDKSVKEIADTFAINPSHLMRQFKKDYGVTITQYRNTKRISEAKELLFYSDLSITDIGFITGFNSSQYFSKVFRKEVTMSPYKYRKNNNNKQK